MRDWRVACAYGLFALAVVLAGVAIGGALLTGVDWGTAVSSYLVTNTAIGVSAAPCGLLIARAKPHNPIGWLFLGLGVAPLGTAAMVPLHWYGAEAGWPQGVMRLVVTVFMFSWPWGLFVCLPLALQLFPTGRPVTPRWRALVWFTLAFAVIGAIGTGPTPELGASSYFVWPGYRYAEVAAGNLGLVVIGLSIVSLVVRYVRGDEVVQRQLLWLILAVLFAMALNLPWAFSLHEDQEILFILAFPLIPAAVTVAVLRHQLFDVRLVFSRTVLYALLTAGVVVTYLGLVAVLDRLLRGAGAPVLATLVVALAFNPVRTRLQRVVDRALYGAGRDPVRAVSAVGERLAGEDLAGVLDALREALRLPYTALEVGRERIAAGGEPAGTLHVTPLMHRGERMGQLMVGARWGERRLPAADRAVLDLLAGPLAIAVRATSLSGQLQASRERLVTASAEERRRLHRELHDSLGPVLTGAALKADGTALAARTDPERAERLASELADQLRQAIGDVRRIVYGLRPPALDELGLVAALRRQQGRLGEIDLTVDAPDPLPPLPAAVEVAAYRIATEAVTNVVRHSSARQAVVSLHADSAALRISVTDDGTSANGWTPGVGLHSIRERVAEVGGECEAGPTPDGGRVVAVLPLRGPS
jgi:two-component system, NarL family, sensor kinase